MKPMITYSACTGKTIKELLRVIESLQLTQEYKVAIPAHWKEGEAVVRSTCISNEKTKIGLLRP